MSILSSHLLPYFSSWTGNVSAALVGLGVLCLSIATFNQTKIVWYTGNTTGLIEKFMIFSCGTAILMGGSSIASMAAGSTTEWYVIDGLFTFVNACSFAANFYTYKKKKENMAKAAKAGMSEQDYYNQIVLPHLNQQLG